MKSCSPKSNLDDKPDFLVSAAIGAFIGNNISETDLNLNRLKILIDADKSGKSDSKISIKRSQKAYFTFLSALLSQSSYETTGENEKIFHLGDSHCLSFAHKNILFLGKNYKIFPHITIGAKAYHFAKNGMNNYKAITHNNLQYIPKYSKVFLSFGEIDCRLHGGLITAAQQNEKELKSLVKNTVKKYVGWFEKLNESLMHELFFFNVPAPIFDSRFSEEENFIVCKTVRLFNVYLSFFIKKTPFHLIDVYRPTALKNGFSNKKFHIDRNHLSHDIIYEKDYFESIPN